MRLVTMRFDMDDVKMMLGHYGAYKNLSSAALRKAESENVDGSRCEFHRRNRRETLVFDLPNIVTRAHCCARRLCAICAILGRADLTVTFPVIGKVHVSAEVSSQLHCDFSCDRKSPC